MNSLEQQIDQQYDSDVEQQLSDSALYPRYLQQKSVSRRLESFVSMLQRHHLPETTISNIATEYLSQMIPPGAQAVVRGARFEEIVRQEIEDMKLDPDVYDVRFEKDIISCRGSDEVPDFVIRHRLSNRLLLGMVQTDLWNGGHQLNRGYKYVFHPYNRRHKMLCVVAHRPRLTSPASKVSRMVAHGLEHKTLCYVRGLQAAIQAFF